MSVSGLTARQHLLILPVVTEFRRSGSTWVQAIPEHERTWTISGWSSWHTVPPRRSNHQPHRLVRRDEIDLDPSSRDQALEQGVA